jgi:hypothetical protein
MEFLGAVYVASVFVGRYSSRKILSAYQVNSQAPKTSGSPLKPRSTIPAIRIGHTLHNNDTPRFLVLSRICYPCCSDDAIYIDQRRCLRRIDIVCLLRGSWSRMGVRVFELVVECGAA